MAYFSKEIYEQKNEYAAKRMEENAKIKTLTEDQHKALAMLCKIRHFVHSTERMSLFNSESNDALQMTKYLMRIYDGDLLEVVGLPCLNTIDFMCLPESQDWYDLLTEEERKEFDGDYQIWLEQGDEYYDFCDMIEEFNRDIENYLRAIDEIHGTKYCPTGMSRNI